MNWKKICAAVIAGLALAASQAYARDLAKGEWYVTLILKSDSGGLEDSYNQLGQLSDALPGFDSYDLPELGQTWPGTYLSVIFYRPDWGTDLPTYNTDYHPMSPKKTSDVWTFEVRSDDPARDLSLTWKGKRTRMNKMVLVDLQENVAVRAAIDGVPQPYRFRMNGVVREFAWRDLTNKQYEQFLATGELPTNSTAETVRRTKKNSADVSLRAIATDTASNGGQSSGWLPLGWGQGEGQGYSRDYAPTGLPADPFGD